MANVEGYTFTNATNDASAENLNETVRDAVIDGANNITGVIPAANIGGLEGMSDNEIFAQVSGTAAGYPVDPIRSILGIDEVGGLGNIESAATRDQTGEEIATLISGVAYNTYAMADFTVNADALTSSATKIASATLSLPEGYEWSYIDVGFYSFVTGNSGSFQFSKLEIGGVIQSASGLGSLCLGSPGSFQSVTTRHTFIPSTVDASITIDYYANYYSTYTQGDEVSNPVNFREGHALGVCHKV